MFEKLRATEEHFEDISEKLTMPDIISDNEKYTALMKEYKALEPIVEKYREYEGYRKSEAEALEIIEESGVDKEMKELAREELDEARAGQERTGEELKVLLIPRDPNDDKNVVIEIRGGAGGEEASLFAGSLFRMYGMYAEAHRWKIDILNENATELGGYKEISFSVEGAGAYSRLKYESGVHRVQRVPETESQGRIHTSTVTVAVLPEADEIELEINPVDLKIDVFRASGAGGQHINKTESAVRIIHIPTGTVVECQDERSQHKNKDKAMKILRSRLYDRLLTEKNEKIASDRRSQVGTGSRSERIRTYNFPESRLTDHRIGLTIYRLESILNGDLDEVIDALTTADRAAKLAEEN
ncbi:MAG: peptide chain release factor 1 [Oscillospiraceae bacterium]|nr:peptide chain release factor 1 [Oscillospiraceae bacterium]